MTRYDLIKFIENIEQNWIASEMVEEVDTHMDNNGMEDFEIKLSTGKTLVGKRTVIDAEYDENGELIQCDYEYELIGL